MTDSNQKDQCPTKSFDVAIKNLLRSMAETHEQSVEKGVMGFAQTGNSQPYWVICREKFHSLYLKCNKPSAFESVFRAFYKKYRDDLIEPIIEEGKVYDEWLKTEEILPGPVSDITPKRATKKRSAKISHVDGTLSWTPNATCKGIVLYFDEKDPKFRAVSIPVSEAYVEACKQYAKLYKEKKIHSALPVTILFSLYACVYHVATEEDKEALQENLVSLKEVLQTLLPEGNNDEGSTLNPIKEMIKAFAKNSGMATVLGNMDDGKVNEAFSTLFSSETTEKIGSVIRTVNDKMKDTNTNDIGEVLTKVGSVLSSNEVKEQIKETVDLVQGINSSSAAAAKSPTQVPFDESNTEVVASQTLTDSVTINIPQPEAGASEQE